MPGVTYEKQVQFTFHGPSVIHVLTMPRPGGLWALKPVLSNDAILGLERVTSIQQRVSATATVAGVNGDRFVSNGRPSGIFMRDGQLQHGPGDSRSSIGIDSGGNLRVERVRLLPTWQGTGQRQNLSAVNNSPSSSGMSLYTPTWGPATPAAPGALEVVLRPFPATLPNTEVAGPVTEVRSGGGAPIPPDGAVLVARGTTATNRLRNEAPAGATVRVRLVLQPDWAGVVDAVGGGPALVREGKAVFNAGEAFVPSQLALPEPRTAVGQLADGRIVLVVVDGRLRGYSSGMTNFELALALVRLGAVTGAALDGGGSSTMAFDGQLLNRPSGAERPVSEALLVVYSGVYAPLPGVSVVSPNGDGVAETQSLAYKVVRPSTVSASLIAPDGSTRPVFSGPGRRGNVRLRVVGQHGRRHARARRPVAVGCQSHRRPRRGDVRRAAVLAQHDARVREGRCTGAVRAAPPREGSRAVRAGPVRVRDDSDRDPLGNGDQEGGSGRHTAGRPRERHVGRQDEQGRAPFTRGPTSRA